MPRVHARWCARDRPGEATVFYLRWVPSSASKLLTVTPSIAGVVACWRTQHCTEKLQQIQFEKPNLHWNKQEHPLGLWGKVQKFAKNTKKYNKIANNAKQCQKLPKNICTFVLEITHKAGWNSHHCWPAERYTPHWARYPMRNLLDCAGPSITYINRSQSCYSTLTFGRNSFSDSLDQLLHARA